MFELTEDQRKKLKSPMGKFYTDGLFYERALDKSNVLYTMRDYDYKGHISLYRVYLELEDPTEWEVANRCFQGTEHWNRLLKAQWFSKYVVRLRNDLELKLKSESLKYLVDEARFGGKSQFQANRYLLDSFFSSQKELNKSGEKVTKKAIIGNLPEEDMRILKDMERIQGVVLN